MMHDICLYSFLCMSADGLAYILFFVCQLMALYVDYWKEFVEWVVTLNDLFVRYFLDLSMLELLYTDHKLNTLVSVVNWCLFSFIYTILCVR